MSHAKKTAKKKIKVKSKKTRKILERKKGDPWFNLPEIPDLSKPKINTKA